jgi:hypothetical protein
MSFSSSLCVRERERDRGRGRGGGRGAGRERDGEGERERERERESGRESEWVGEYPCLKCSTGPHLIKCIEMHRDISMHDMSHVFRMYSAYTSMYFE